MKKLAPNNIGIKELLTDELVPNPHNPRLLFDRSPLEDLKSSIDKVGILVPLTVYFDKQKNKYVILDGQRRWICAKKLNKKVVPVNQVAEPTLVQNIVTMFQIHQLRADWELMPTALKLNILMRELKENNVRKLSGFTGLDQAVVVRCKKLLSYSKRHQDLMLAFDPEKRIKADFFIELYAVRSDRFVTKQRWFSKDQFTDSMLDKYLHGNGAIKSVTDFRIIKQYINNALLANKEKQLMQKFEKFVNDAAMPIDYLRIPEADISVNVRKIINYICKIEDVLNNLDINTVYGEESLWLHLARLMKLIQKILQNAGKRIQ